MINKIVTFYAKELPNVDQVIGYQRKVFNHFGLDIEQVEFTDKLRHPHSEAMTDYLKTITNWDTITIFDIDCIPTSTDTIIDVLEIIKDGNTIYGNAQSTKNSTPFAAPNFLNFSHDVWDKTVDIWEKNPYIKRDIFRYQVVTNEDGSETMMDVAERFNIEHRKTGTKVVLSYPIKNEGKPEWNFEGNDDFPRFEWGNGTWFDSKTFHGSEIRYPHKQQVFFDICQKIIS